MDKNMLTTPRFRVVSKTSEDGKTHYFLKKPDAVGIIVEKKKQIGLLKVNRTFIKKLSLELVGGRIERGESPAAAAKRELSEEIGVKGVVLTYLTEIYPLPSVVDERLTIFSADIQDEVPLLSKSEGIQDFSFYSFAQIHELIVSRKIINGGDAFALLYFLTKRGLYG